MTKDVNIHVKTTGTPQARQDIDSFARSVEEMGAKTSRAGGWIKEAFTALVGPLGIGALVTLGVAAVRKFILALDDMKRAASEAVLNMATLQRQAGNFFEAMDAYSGPQRKAALAQVRGVQAATGLPDESAMQILEAQKRTFGIISPESTQQFAAYYAMHAGPATTDLIRWMGESGIKTPQQQSQIMRMISAVSQQKGLTDEELITALITQGEKFRYLGWSPEQTIENLGKALVPGEGPRGVQRLFAAIEGFTEDKARRLGAGPSIAIDEAKRLQWIQQRPELFQKAFGPAAPYIKRLFGPAGPLEIPTAEEETAKFRQWQQTEEARVEMTKGAAVQQAVSPQKITEALIREHGRAYLEYLRVNNPRRYNEITNFGFTQTAEEEMAAKELFRTLAPPEPPGFITNLFPTGPLQRLLFNPPGWNELTPKGRLAGLEVAAGTINNIHYHRETIFNPVISNPVTGPRVTPEDLQ
jgi:hypothetical protein